MASRPGAGHDGGWPQLRPSPWVITVLIGLSPICTLCPKLCPNLVWGRGGGPNCNSPP